MCNYTRSFLFGVFVVCPKFIGLQLFVAELKMFLIQQRLIILIKNQLSHIQAILLPQFAAGIYYKSQLLWVILRKLDDSSSI